MKHLREFVYRLWFQYVSRRYGGRTVLVPRVEETSRKTTPLEEFNSLPQEYRKAVFSAVERVLSKAPRSARASDVLRDVKAAVAAIPRPNIPPIDQAANPTRNRT